MRYREIPGTELRPSVICMGGLPLCIENDDNAVFALLDTYFDLGGTFIDSANVYGKWLPSGRNICDLNLGTWLQSRGVRDKITLATKGGHPPLDARSSPRLSRREVLEDLEESLRALRTDCVDLYYLHRDDERLPVEVMIDYLNDFVREGKIRYFGCSNWRPSRIRAAQEYAIRSRQQGFCANQLMWSYIEPDVAKYPYPGTVSMQTSLDYHRESGLTAIAYSSLANGFLSKYAAGNVPALADCYRSEDNLRLAERAIRLSSQSGLSLTEIALGFILSHPFPTFAIVGSHTTAQITDSMAAGTARLTPEQMHYLATGREGPDAAPGEERDRPSGRQPEAHG